MSKDNELTDLLKYEHAFTNCGDYPFVDVLSNPDEKTFLVACGNASVEMLRGLLAGVQDEVRALDPFEHWGTSVEVCSDLLHDDRCLRVDTCNRTASLLVLSCVLRRIVALGVYMQWDEVEDISNLPYHERRAEHWAKATGRTPDPEEQDSGTGNMALAAG